MPDLVDGRQPVFCTLLKAIFSVVGVCFNTPELRFFLQEPLIEGSGYEKFEIMTFTSGFKMENCCFRSVPLTRRLATLWTGMSNTPKLNDKQWKFRYCFKGYAFILFIITMNHSVWLEREPCKPYTVKKKKKHFLNIEKDWMLRWADNIRDLKQLLRRRQQQRQKTIGFMRKTTALHVHHAF